MGRKKLVVLLKKIKKVKGKQICRELFSPIWMQIVTDTIFLPLTSCSYSVSLQVWQQYFKSTLRTRAAASQSGLASLYNNTQLCEKHTRPICSEETGWKATCSWPHPPHPLHPHDRIVEGAGQGPWWKDPSISWYIKILQRQRCKL